MALTSRQVDEEQTLLIMHVLIAKITEKIYDKYRVMMLITFGSIISGPTGTA